MGVEGLVAKNPPAVPKWLFFLQVGIIVLSFGCLIAGAVNVSSFGGWARYSASSGPGGFLIFDAIFTWIIVGTMIAFERFAPQFYLRLTYVVLLPLSAIFWLSAWAWAASVASVWSGYDSSFWGGELSRYSASIAACAALGAFTWVAVVALTILYVLACFRDSSETPSQTEMGMSSKAEPAPAAAPAPAPAAATDAGAFNQQTQDYYGANPQQASPYPADNTPAQKP